ncbi:kinase-like protein [Neoconidiobolus thromboides FSU 785]|nr:kinase-like protein [Neoconidiobolus thromboides FSU 785]
MSSHSLLLRLFNSEFFNPWFAVSYLHRYPENIGIQHYLCNRLKEFPNNETIFFLPQLCHFLITRPNSIAVELFLINLCLTNNHFAILTYWYFDAYNSDIGDQVLHPGYKICRRILKKCQKILFQEQNLSIKNPSLAHNSSTNSISTSIKQDKIKENIAPAMMGMASIMFSLVSPKLAKVASDMALAEGSRPKLYNLAPPPTIESRPRPSSSVRMNEKLSFDSNIRRKSADNDKGMHMLKDGYKPIVSLTDPPSPDEYDPNQLVAFSTPSLEELRNGQAFSLLRYLDKKSVVNKQIGLQIPDKAFNKKNRLSLGSGDLSKFGEVEPNDSEGEDRGYFCESDSENSDYTPLRRPSKQMINSHYFHTEIQFVLTLMSISNRLCLVPKISRQSSLQAELALLNHNLPADICIPLWCSTNNQNSYHHKVVRISSKDAVVLNSAERVPYLIFIEVLEDEKGIEIEKAEEQKRPVGIPDSYSYETTPLPDAFSGEVTMGNNSQQNQIYFQSVLSRRSSNAQDEYSESMRTAAVMLAQLTLDKKDNQQKTSTSAKANSYKVDSKELIREKIINEMAQLEKNRMDKMNSYGMKFGIGGSGGEGNGGELVDEKELMKTVYNRDDPSAAVFKEDWKSKEKRIRQQSPFGERKNWKLLPLIVKTGADLRQEQFALQLIQEMERIWKDNNCNIFVKLFNIMITSKDNGFVEMVKNTISVHSLKKDAYARGYNTKGVIYSLYDHFVREFGDPSSSTFLKAQDNFMRSLVGYSLITYILQLRDRHNGNILVDTEGHLVHIDFGFMLSNSPGSVGFELAPFKMTQEYLDILGGVNSIKFEEFKQLMKKGFLLLRKYADNILLLTEMMQKDSKLPCFSSGITTISNLKERFCLNLNDAAIEDMMDKLILSSSCNVFTRLYDTFQYYSNSIL